MKKLTIIIVSYNVRQYIDQCLQSVEKAMQGIDAEIMVVDNKSQDDTVAYIGEHYPRVRVIESGDNLGFARANNMGIRQSESEYVLLLNPDTVVAEKTLHEVLQFMEAHDTVGAAGVQTYYIQRGPTTGDPDLENDLTHFYSGTALRCPTRKLSGIRISA